MVKIFETKIFSKDDLKEAASLICSGELVAFPTETVYGLGADALNGFAVRKIFEAKNRPQDNPLIVHVCSVEQVESLCFLNDDARRLMSEFWPGPLAIILKKKSVVPIEVTAGLNTVALRMPNHGVALDFIRLANTPIAAPSANISGRPSSTSFKHVFEDLNGRVSGIIKDEESVIGLESSVVDLTSDPPLLLRPGGVNFEDLKSVLPSLELYKGESVITKSPGMKYKHYSPRAKIILFEASAKNKVSGYLEKLRRDGFRVEVLNIDNTLSWSHNLFSKFRDLDELKVDYILINSVSEAGIGLAIMNRVRKAAFEIVK